MQLDIFVSSPLNNPSAIRFSNTTFLECVNRCYKPRGQSARRMGNSRLLLLPILRNCHSSKHAALPHDSPRMAINPFVHHKPRKLTRWNVEIIAVFDLGHNRSIAPCLCQDEMLRGSNSDK
ncbi:hypothetical protein C8J56DRAFT_1037729 [Mycena floridula]|nr:hypothetical protein C8J56DRAFT_1037729 [Mycena floridula]